MAAMENGDLERAVHEATEEASGAVKPPPAGAAEWRSWIAGGASFLTPRVIFREDLEGDVRSIFWVF